MSRFTRIAELIREVILPLTPSPKSETGQNTVIDAVNRSKNVVGMGVLLRDLVLFF
ncbi:MAG: hypothetical protein Q4G33_14195 [bacterium]|nr:hypothetical protein [bacterium]